MGLGPGQMPEKPPVHELALLAGPPPPSPQCAGASVGASDSKDDHADAPNSEKNMPGACGP